MYVLDIFFKRRKFIGIFERSWKRVADKITLDHETEDEAERQLDLFYFVSIIYSMVFHSALAAEMNESSAHYLARIQTKKSKVDGPIVTAVEKMFSTPEDQPQQEYVAAVNAVVAPLVAADPAPEDDVKSELDSLQRLAKNSGFSARELFAEAT